MTIRSGVASVARKFVPVILAQATLLAVLSCHPAPAARWVEPTSGMVFLLVPAGSFEMGSPDQERGREEQEALHPARLSRAFYLGQAEVTQAQWSKIMGSNPSHFQDCGPDCPVENVSWHDAQAFVRRLSRHSGETFRLPTEAEWEYACRAGTRTAFAFGPDLLPEHANVDGDPPLPGWPAGIDRDRTTPAGSFPANRWGFFDLHGNVWEWTSDAYCAYSIGLVVDPRPVCDSELKVIRGGSWHFGPDSARCALRYTHLPSDIGPSLGFRVAREIPPSPPLRP